MQQGKMMQQGKLQIFNAIQWESLHKKKETNYQVADLPPKIIY